VFRILVSGLINIETTVAIDGFPLTYFPVRFPFFGVRSTVSGVGYNVAKALRKLGNEPRLVSLIGPDPMGSLVRQAFETDGLPASYLSDSARETPESVILFDPSGRRQIHVDLKNVQESVLPQSLFSEALDGADACALCNINFSRPYLKRVKESGKLIATDVHTLSDPDDSYNRDFMAAADVLFLSDEALPAKPDEVARELILSRRDHTARHQHDRGWRRPLLLVPAPLFED
jgi:ribokinase